MHISWDEFERDCDTLANKINHGKKWIGLIAVQRGGIIPAARLAYTLGTRYIHIVKVDKDEPSISLPEVAFTDYSRWILIDEIVDTGRTVRLLRDYFRNTPIAVLYAKEASKHLVDYCSKIIPDEWIHLPWEVD